MTVMLACPSDDSMVLPPELVVDAPAGFMVPPDPPPPAPGDPATPLPDVVAHPFGRRVQVYVCEPVTHLPICEIRSARKWEGDERFGPGTCSFTASTRDPGWLSVADVVHSVRGVDRAKPNLKGLEIVVGLDGVRVWSGVLQQPQSWSGATVQIKADSAEAQFSERTLGETQQHDYYEGRGSFPTTDLTGFEFDDSISHLWNTTTQYEGARSLHLTSADGDTGAGWMYGPWVLMPGQEGFPRYPVGSVLVHAPEGVKVTVGVFVETADGSAVINADFTKAAFADSDDSESVWQGPVAGRGRLLGEAVEQWVRVGVHLTRGVQCDIDLMRLQWPTLTGYPDKQDLVKYPARILRDAQRVSLGGVNYGIPVTTRGATGKTAKITWPHQDDHPIDECVSTVTSMDGGPDFHITPGFRGISEPRWGVDRRDIALTAHHIIACTPNVDPGGQVDELRGTTDIGTGSYRHVFGFDAPRVAHRRRIRKLVPVPSGLNYDAGKAWTDGQGRFASQEPFSATVTVDLDFGLQIGVGDGSLFAYEDGWVWAGAVRVGARRLQPSLGLAVLEVGTDAVVAL